MNCEAGGLPSSLSLHQPTFPQTSRFTLVGGTTTFLRRRSYGPRLSASLLVSSVFFRPPRPSPLSLHQHNNRCNFAIASVHVASNPALCYSS